MVSSAGLNNELSVFPAPDCKSLQTVGMKKIALEREPVRLPARMGKISFSIYRAAGAGINLT